MNLLASEGPIIACSTGTTTNTAIGVIRISGFDDISKFQKFFQKDLSKVKPRYSYLSDLYDPATGIVLDNIVFVFYKGPNSYNGENILELSVHGNQINIRRVIDSFVKNSDCSHARPGEFTLRALQNKKLSLSQVEGLDLLLNASSSAMLNQGLGAMQGELHQKYVELHDVFVKLKASIELSIDFLDDIGEEAADEVFNRNLGRFSALVDELYTRTRGNISNLSTPVISLIGQANAGKSSLFNKLLRENRSIVTSQAGTTRDYVSEFITVEETTFRLVDTAGIRQAFDQVEIIGIERSFSVLKNSFFKVLVFNPFETNKDDYAKLTDENFDLLVVSHCDREGWEELYNDFKSSLPKSDKIIFTSFVGPIEPVMNIENGPMGPVTQSGPIEPIEKVIKFIEDAVTEKYLEMTAHNPIFIDRHRVVISDIYEKLNDFKVLSETIGDIAVISSEFDLIGKSVFELIGVVTADDVLNDIFGNFCIGK